jgi:putative transcriptional regulator
VRRPRSACPAKSSRQIAQALGERLETIGLSRNLTQVQAAEDAGVSLSTLKRLESGRILSALRLQDHLAALPPDPGIRPVARAPRQDRPRRRARPQARSAPDKAWTWGGQDPT